MKEESKPVTASITNVVSVLAPVLTALAVALGIPIPGDALAPVIVSVVQGILTLFARNRKNGGMRTRWGIR